MRGSSGFGTGFSSESRYRLISSGLSGKPFGSGPAAPAREVRPALARRAPEGFGRGPHLHFRGACPFLEAPYWFTAIGSQGVSRPVRGPGGESVKRYSSTKRVTGTH